MARRCQITGKGPQTGNARSHSMRATKRRFLPNIVKKTLILDGRKVRVRIATSTLRTLMKQDPKVLRKMKKASKKRA